MEEWAASAVASTLPSPASPAASPRVASCVVVPASEGRGAGSGEKVKGLLGVVVVPDGNENQRPVVPHEAGANVGENVICVEAWL